MRYIPTPSPSLQLVYLLPRLTLMLPYQTVEPSNVRTPHSTHYSDPVDACDTVHHTNKLIFNQSSHSNTKTLIDVRFYIHTCIMIM